MCREAAEQADEADEAFAGAGQTGAPAHARAGRRRGHRFAAYPRCSADCAGASLHSQVTDVDWSAALLDLVKREHCNIPMGAWGFFFPVSIAVWRLADEMAGGQLGPVHAAWLDRASPVDSEVEVSGSTYLVRRRLQPTDPSQGPAFFGSGGAWLMEHLQGELLDAVEALAYAVLEAVNRDRAESGRLRPDDIGVVDSRLVKAVASLTQRAVRGSERNAE